MGTFDVLLMHGTRSAEDRRGSDRRIAASLVAGAIVAAALFAVALLGSDPAATDPTVTHGIEAAASTALDKRVERSGILMAHQIRF
jgi:hypothetical protein